MSEKMSQSAYQLTWELDHLDFYEVEHDAKLMPFPGSEQIIALADAEPYNFAEPVFFEANSHIVNNTDFPENDVDWPIMSRQMIEVLQSLGDFPHQIIPILMNSSYTSENSNHDFVAVQLTSHLRIFNYENSRYRRRDEDFPEIVIGVSEFAIDIPSEGLPPLFRLSAYDIALFISGEAREALRECDIKGTAYVPLYGYRDGNRAEVDIPVPTLINS